MGADWSRARGTIAAHVTTVIAGHSFERRVCVLTASGTALDSFLLRLVLLGSDVALLTTIDTRADHHFLEHACS